jgi:hypothetical protein
MGNRELGRINKLIALVLRHFPQHQAFFRTLVSATYGTKCPNAEARLTNPSPLVLFCDDATGPYPGGGVVLVDSQASIDGPVACARLFLVTTMRGSGRESHVPARNRDGFGA